MTSFPKEKNLTQTGLRGLSLHRSLGLLCRKVYDLLPMCGPGSGLGAQVRVHGAPSFPLALAGCREPGPEGAGWRSSLRGPEVYFLSPACSPPSPADACVSSGSLMCCLPPPDIPRSPDFIVQFSPVTRLCPTLCNPWTAARQASLSITNSRNSPKLMCIESVMGFIVNLCIPEP